MFSNKAMKSEDSYLAQLPYPIIFYNYFFSQERDIELELGDDYILDLKSNFRNPDF